MNISYSSILGPTIGFFYESSAGACLLVSAFAICLRNRRSTFSETLPPLCIFFATAATGYFLILLSEIGFALFSSNQFQSSSFWSSRITGPYGWVYCITILVRALPMLFWLPPIRATAIRVLSISFLAHVPHLINSLVVVITAFDNDFLPASWYH